jgi:hypothetical protein
VLGFLRPSRIAARIWNFCRTNLLVIATEIS